MNTRDDWLDKRIPQSRYSSNGDMALVSNAFLTEELTKYLDLIQHLAINSDRIPLVRGDHGVGKSTLLSLLVQQAPANWIIHTIHATPMLQPEQLANEIRHRFSSKQERIKDDDQLVRRFTELRRKGQLPVVIIDDTEQLPVSALQELFNIFSRSSDQISGLSLVLCATPLIDNLLEKTRLPLVTEKIQTLNLTPLNRIQTEKFIYHLLTVQAIKPNASISEVKIEKIFLSGGGLPEKIFQQVEEILRPKITAPAVLTEWRAFLPRLLSDASRPALIAGVILSMLLLLTLVYEEEINSVFVSDANSDRQTGGAGSENRLIVPLIISDQPMKVERNLSAQTSDIERAEASNAAIKSDESQESDPLLKFTDTAENDVMVAETINLPLLATLTPTDEPETDTPAQPQQPKSQVIANKTETSKSSEQLRQEEKFPDSATNPIKTMGAEVIPDQNAQPQPQPTSIKKIESSIPAPVTELGQSVKGAQKDSPEPNSVITKKKTKSPSRVSDASIKGEQWLLKQSPNSYTLQLIGLGDEQSATDFIRRYKLERNATYFKTKLNGRPWFPVLYGIYTDRERAIVASSQLPADLKKKGPWPRSLASVQQAIKE